MKKLILGVAAISLLLVASSCNKETAESATDRNGEISLRPVLGKQTISSRAEEMTTTGLQTDANSTATGIPVRIFDDAAADPTTPWNSWSLYYANNAWTYDTPTLQPQLDLVYYAWYPNTAAAMTTLFARTAAGASFGYTVQAVASQEDLIASTVAATNATNINLQFSHLLSQVNFAVQEVNDIQVEITKIELKNIGNTAVYTFGNPGSWATPTAFTGAYEYALRTSDFPTDLGTDIVSLGSGSSTDANALMLMPQSFAGTTAAFDITFRLLIEGSPNNIYYAGDATNSVTATAYLKDFNTTTWAPGKRYVYLIDFTNYLADKYIKFTVEVKDWENDNGGKYLAVEVAKANKASLEGAIASLAAYATTGEDILQITVNDQLTANIDLAIDNTLFSQNDKIVIYFNDGIDSSSPTITATGWSTSPSGSTFTLSKD